MALPVLARRTAAAGLTGFEWAVGVPGSVGGAVRMNAGGHGSDMAACLLDVEVVDLAAADPQPVTARRRRARPALPRLGPGAHERRRRRPARGCAAATGPPPRPTIAEIVRWRREHQPGGQNAGSVFVNPVPGEVSAGSLDRRARPARVPHRHGVGVREARQLHPGRRGRPAADVRAVIEAVRRRVADATGLPAAQRGPSRRLPRRGRFMNVGGGPRRDAAALPRPDVPSAEVLDELLQAFSVDVSDRARFDEIDLTSPEVERLLTPAAPSPPEADVEAASDNSQPSVEVDSKAADEGAEASPPAATPPPVVITDQSIPDAVYVQGNLATDSAGDRSTIFIDDHGEHRRDDQHRGRDRGDPHRAPAARPADRGAAGGRPQAAQVGAHRHRGRRGRRRWAGRARVVAVRRRGRRGARGPSTPTSGRSPPSSPTCEGTPVLRVDTDAAERELEAIPWVEERPRDHRLPRSGQDRDPGADPRGHLRGRPTTATG